MYFSRLLTSPHKFNPDLHVSALAWGIAPALYLPALENHGLMKVQGEPLELFAHTSCEESGTAPVGKRDSGGIEARCNAGKEDSRIVLPELPEDTGPARQVITCISEASSASRVQPLKPAACAGCET